MRAPGSRLGSLTTCVLFLGLAACEDASEPDSDGTRPDFAPAEVVTDVFREEVDFTDFILCTNEPVHFTGFIQFEFHEISNRGAPPPEDPGVQHFSVNITVHFSGVGEISGEKYTFISYQHDNTQSPDPVEAFPTRGRFTFRDRIIGPGGFLGFATFTGQFVLNGTGELVFDRGEFTEECR